MGHSVQLSHLSHLYELCIYKKGNANKWVLMCFHVGISVYVKECPVCRNIVRFQEYNAGFHNYNNRVFLSIPLCSFLTTGLSVSTDNRIVTTVGHFCTKLSTYKKIYNIYLKHLFYSLQNHIAIGRMLRTIESHSGTKVPYNTLRKAFYHFSALRKYSYNYFCYRCGHHPSVVIADTNWKVAFELPGKSDFKMYFKTSSKIDPTFTCILSLSFFQNSQSIS